MQKMPDEDFGRAMGGAALSRRELLRMLGVSAGAVSLGGLMAACGSDDDDDDNDDSPTATSPAAGAPDPTATDASGGQTTSAGESTATESDTNLDPAERPVLRIGVQGLPGGLDPYLELSNVGTRVTYAIFDHLLERDFINGDPPGTGADVLPMLAESWERVDDLTLQLTLRPDVVFHNGEALTAEDVKFSFDRHLIDSVEELVEAQAYISTISEIEVVDDRTLLIHTAKPDPLLEIRLTSWATWIMPRRYYDEVGMEGFAQAPVGSGPYKFVELRQDEVLVLESHDEWWGGLPTARRVEYRVMPEIASRVAALVSGEVEIITNVPPDQVETLDASDGVGVRSVPLANCHVLRYNPRHPSMSSKLLRQAMNLAIDRELLVESLWGGRAVLMRGHQFPEYAGPIGGSQYNEERPYTPFDPDRARELVAESGYEGEKIVVRSGASYYTNGAEAAQAIVQMWQDVGINAEVEITEDTTAGGPEAMQVNNWSNSSFVADPDGAFWLRWGEPTPVQRDFWTPENPRFNELGNAARETLDVDFRYEAYQEMLDIFEDEAPGTVLYIPIENYGVRSNVEWLPYSFYYMDLRPDVLKIDQ
jgi:peptide/nickel transport system substrate-binding protein